MTRRSLSSPDAVTSLLMPASKAAWSSTPRTHLHAVDAQLAERGLDGRDPDHVHEQVGREVARGRDHRVRELLHGHGAAEVAIELGIGVAVEVEHVELVVHDAAELVAHVDGRVQGQLAPAHLAIDARAARPASWWRRRGSTRPRCRPTAAWSRSRRRRCRGAPGRCARGWPARSSRASSPGGRWTVPAPAAWRQYTEAPALPVPQTSSKWVSRLKSRKRSSISGRVRREQPVEAEGLDAEGRQRAAHDDGPAQGRSSTLRARASGQVAQEAAGERVARRRSGRTPPPGDRRAPRRSPRR